MAARPRCFEYKIRERRWEQQSPCYIRYVQATHGMQMEFTPLVHYLANIRIHTLNECERFDSFGSFANNRAASSVNAPLSVP